MRKIIEETKQHLVDIMKGDEELGLYELGQRVQPFVQLEESKEERMYSEQQVLKLLIKFSDDRTFLKEDVAIQWFDKNKKQ